MLGIATFLLVSSTGAFTVGKDMPPSLRIVPSPDSCWLIYDQGKIVLAAYLHVTNSHDGKTDVLPITVTLRYRFPHHSRTGTADTIPLTRPSRPIAPRHT